MAEKYTEVPYIGEREDGTPRLVSKVGLEPLDERGDFYQAGGVTRFGRVSRTGHDYVTIRQPADAHPVVVSKYVSPLFVERKPPKMQDVYRVTGPSEETSITHQLGSAIVEVKASEVNLSDVTVSARRAELFIDGSIEKATIKEGELTVIGDVGELKSIGGHATIRGDVARLSLPEEKSGIVFVLGETGEVEDEHPWIGVEQKQTRYSDEPKTGLVIGRSSRHVTLLRNFINWTFGGD